MTYKALIVDDEKNPRERLRDLLAGWDKVVEIVGEAGDGPEALERIRQLRPDLIFLDIRLPGMDGFEVIQSLERQPLIIFTTAYHEHALEAFGTNSIGYLLKPVREEDLARTLTKLVDLEKIVRGDERKRGEEDMLSQIKDLLSASNPAIIPCRIGDKTQLVKPSEILYFMSDSRYTFVHTSSGKKLIVDTPLVDLERRLHPKEFIRIRRGTIVNINWVAEVRRLFNGGLKVILLDQKATELMASRRYADYFRNL